MAYSATATATATATEDLMRSRDYSAATPNSAKSLTSAVSWGAMAAGAAAAASLSLILLILGVGLGLSSVSPWARDGVSAATFGVSTILWLTLTQLLASAVASLATAALLTSVISSILSGGAQIGPTMIGGVASTAGSTLGGAAAPPRLAQGSEAGPMGYFIDSLFRRDPVAATPVAGSAVTPSGVNASERTAGAEVAEVGRIFMNASRSQPLPPDDVRHVGQIVAQRTGLSQQDAEKRVTAVYVKAQATARDAETAARNAADVARKASAYSALWLVVSLLLGAFVASLSATFGGHRRDL